MVENRKGCVEGHRSCEPNDLAQVVHCRSRHGRLKFPELCKAVGKRSDAMARMTDGHSEDLTLGLAIAVCQVQRDTAIFEEACRRVGGVFVPLPDAHGADEDIYAALSMAVEELGQDSGVIRRILADCAVTAEEAEQAAREIDETIASLVHLKHVVFAKVRKPSLLTSARVLA
jgi:hypothetical protein